MQHLGNGGTVRELLAAALVTLSASEVKSEQVKGEKNSWGNNSWYGNGGGEWKKGEKWQAVKQDEAEEVDDAEQEVEQGSQIPYSEFLVILPIGIPYIFLVEP